MAIYLLYFMVIVLANTIGAVSGMGGGVIIKPALDAFHFHSLAAITFYSSVAVFTMSLSSTYKQWQNGIKIKWLNAMFISLGAILGGVIGNQLFNYLLSVMESDKKVQLLQIGLTVVSLVLVLVYTLKGSASIQLKNWFAYLSVGVFLGSFSTLLGIGGGPINVSLLIFCFGLTMKDATVYSIITIFFSQLAKLIEVGSSTGYAVYDLSLLVAIIPAAVIGGYLGGFVSGRISDQSVSKIFIVVVMAVIGLNLINGVRLFI